MLSSSSTFAIATDGKRIVEVCTKHRSLREFTNSPWTRYEFAMETVTVHASNSLCGQSRSADVP